MKLKYEYFIGGVHVGIFQATFPFSMLCINDKKLKIKVFFITIFNLFKSDIASIQRIDDNLIKIETIKYQKILFGGFSINKLINKMSRLGYKIDKG